jgi:DNA-binding transcriptional ArsR family regulator
MPGPSSVAPTPTIPLDVLLDAISSIVRWNILRELADGSSLMVSELATRTGIDPSVISRNLAVLRKAGIVINPRIRLFEIAPQYLSDKTDKLLDFGWCALRMNFEPDRD